MRASSHRAATRQFIIKFGKIMIRVATLLACLLSTVPVLAQQFLNQAPYEKILIPVVIQTPVPGAQGSSWVSRTTVRNDASVPVVFSTQTSGPCSLAPYCPNAVPPKTTIADAGLFAQNPNGGLFLYVGAPGRDALTVFARVQDISRQSQTWGTSIPIVRVDDTYTTTLQVAPIPTGSEFRAALRVYDFEPSETAGMVRVRVYPLDSDTLLTEFTMTLLPQSALPFAPPPFAMIDSLSHAFPQIVSSGRVRIEVSPLTAGLRFWAFVSVTNNETQHVTVISPN